MANPKKKTSKSRRDMRRAHDFISRTFSVVCSNCGEPKLRHRVCPGCGQYRGKQLVEQPAATE